MTEIGSLRAHAESLPVDGWVERNEVTGLIYVELFATSIANLKLRAGQFVRLQVMDEPTLLRLGHDKSQ